MLLLCFAIYLEIILYLVGLKFINYFNVLCNFFSGNLLNFRHSVKVNYLKHILKEYKKWHFSNKKEFKKGKKKGIFPSH